MKISTGVAAIKIPDNPPMINIDTKERANNIGVVNCILPPQTVPNQLNTFTALGKAIIIVETMNVMPRTGFIPDMNIWCPQTIKPRPAIAEIEYTIGL